MTLIVFVFVKCHVIIVNRDPLPRPVWEEKEIYRFPDWSAKSRIYSGPNLTTLNFNGLGFVVQHYYREDKTLMGKSISLPHTNTLLNSPNQTSTF